MSLTGHLSDSGSPLRIYLDGVSPSLAELQGSTREARAMAQALGLANLSHARTVVPAQPGVDAARSGTAVDFRARISLGGFDPYGSAAALGIAEILAGPVEVKNGAHRQQVLSEAFDLAARILDKPSDDAEQDRAAILLAHCEQIHRGGLAALKGSLGKALDAAEDGRAFALGIDAPSLADVRSLMESNTHQLNEWQSRILGGEQFEPNPVFAGSELVGGADADWLIGDALIDCKVYNKLTVPTLRGFLRQLLGYVMLDLNDSLGIRRVGVWLPRQGLTKLWSLDRLLGGDPEELLPKLRDGFRAATDSRQVAVRKPTTQQRRNQILADNKHTPRGMLVVLARDNGVDVRFRVGRNAATSEKTVRELARDRYAKVREGVARNRSAPVDVLERLFRDSSVTVRRAAAANPRTPDQPVKALGQGPSTQTRSELRASASKSVAMSSDSDEDAAEHLERDRDNRGLESHWFTEFLLLARGGTTGRSSRPLPVPEASQRSASAGGRSLAVPDWLKTGLPEVAVRNLLREDRPTWVRQFVADSLDISNPDVRDQLLADADPEIRWSALQRTVDAPDDTLGELLDRLAADRKERTRFRTEGSDRSSRARRSAPAECDRQVLALVASHPSTPPTALQGLVGSKSLDIFVSLVLNPSLPTEGLTSLLPRLRSMRSSGHRQRLAASGRIPAAAAEVLIEDRDPLVRTALARNTAVPIEALSLLADDPEPTVRLGVLENRSAPTEVTTTIAELLLAANADPSLLDVLRAVGRREDLQLPLTLVEDALERLSKSRSGQPDMRRIVAGDKRAAPRTLTRLSKIADEDVRIAAAGNPRTPSESLRAHATDTSRRLRAAAASNESLDTDLLVTLAHDDEPGVRSSAARNPNLDPRMLSQLLLDKFAFVRSAAFRNPKTRDSDKTKAHAERKRIWWQSAPNRSVLEEQVASTRTEVRTQVACDERTPPDILALLGGERRSVKVRRAVAANPNASTALLASLAEDEDAEVRQAVAYNSATASETLADLASSGIDLAVLVALNPETSFRILGALSEDTEPLVAHVANESRVERAAIAEDETRRAPEAAVSRASDAEYPTILP